MSTFKLVLFLSLIVYSFSGNCAANCTSCAFKSGSYVCMSCPSGFTASGNGCTQNTGSSGDLLYAWILIGVFGGIFLCCILVALYRKCSQEAPRQTVYQRDQALSAANINQIQQLQKQWKQGQKVLEQNQTCAICLGDKVSISTSCAHLFHVMCINSWISKREATCPLCRCNLSSIRSYCTYCGKSYFQLDVKSLNFISQYKKGQLICKQCEQTSAY